ncbi:putative G-protein coupled receptor 75 [Willisornis vidua]|uniref:G-protein coupled receptor 75 n=1 Tax=Willisornis vidua TaxID=1566151 RepID=A0ABQ9CS47_9PASS|nr:putative G-protein coupled receptor 75 [Willisornis vidua]
MNGSARLPAGPGAQLCANGSGPAELRDGTSAATLAACASLLALVFCLGSYGNLIVLLSFFDPALRKFRTDFDFMVLNLSFCDLFICGVAAPMFAFVLFLGPARGVPATLCFTFRLTSCGFVIMSLQTVAAIALQRLRVVLGRRPPRTASTPRTLLLALGLWATSLGLAALATLRARGSPQCLPVPGLAGARGQLVLSLYIADFMCCVAVVAACYALIARALRRSARARQGPAGVGTDTPGAQPVALYRTQSCAQGPAHPKRLPPASAAGIATAKDTRALATCAIIVLSVLLCCLPLGIALVHGVLSGGASFVLGQFELCGFTLVFFKSGLNPFIYSRTSAGLRRRALRCLRCAALALSCCSHSTRLRAVGKGSLEVNRNKSSHHDTNSAHVLSPKPQRRSAERAGPASRSRDSVLSPGVSAGHQHRAQSSSTPLNTRVEPYYSVYNSSPSQGGSTPSSLQPANPSLAFAKPYLAQPAPGTAPTRHIPVPSV